MNHYSFRKFNPSFAQNEEDKKIGVFKTRRFGCIVAALYNLLNDPWNERIKLSDIESIIYQKLPEYSPEGPMQRLSMENLWYGMDKIFGLRWMNTIGYEEVENLGDFIESHRHGEYFLAIRGKDFFHATVLRDGVLIDKGFRSGKVEYAVRIVRKKGRNWKFGKN